MRKIILILSLFLLSASSYASQKAGEVKSFEGKVLVYESNSPRGEQVNEEKPEFFVGNKIATKRDGKALLELISGDKVALSEKSLMTIDGVEFFKPEEGKVVFHIKKRGKASGVKIGLTTAVIGVKGTKFLVENKENQKVSVYLKEGKINVESKEGDFRRKKDVIVDEYEAYVREMAGEYDEYMKELEEEAIEFIKSFDMEPGQGITIQGQDVKPMDFTEEIAREFDILDQF
jgi:hypothetical protein